MYSGWDLNPQRSPQRVWDFKSHAFQPVSPPEHYSIEGQVGIEPTLFQTPAKDNQLQAHFLVVLPGFEPRQSI